MARWPGLLLLCAALALAACSDDTPIEESEPGTLPDGTVYTGTWGNVCVTDGSGSYAEALELDKASYLFVKLLWISNATCFLSVSGVVSPTATYSELTLTIVGEAVNTTVAGQSAQAAKVSGVSLFATLLPTNAATAAEMNAAALCGFTNWASGVEQDVFGTDCYDRYDTTDPDSTKSSQPAFRDLIYVNDDVSPQRLYFYGSGTRDADGYPTEVDQSRYMVEQ